MSGLDDIEAKLLKVKELRAVERALDLCQRGPINGARVSKIVAEDDAESERSVEIAFTAIESTAIFDAAEMALRARYDALKAELT